VTASSSPPTELLGRHRLAPRSTACGVRGDLRLGVAVLRGWRRDLGSTPRGGSVRPPNHAIPRCDGRHQPESMAACTGMSGRHAPEYPAATHHVRPEQGQHKCHVLAGRNPDPTVRLNDRDVFPRDAGDQRALHARHNVPFAATTILVEPAVSVPHAVKRPKYVLDKFESLEHGICSSGMHRHRSGAERPAVLRGKVCTTSAATIILSSSRVMSRLATARPWGHIRGIR
jgi:hypothetical protein